MYLCQEFELQILDAESAQIFAKEDIAGMAYIILIGAVELWVQEKEGGGVTVTAERTSGQVLRAFFILHRQLSLCQSFGELSFSNSYVSFAVNSRRTTFATAKPPFPCALITISLAAFNRSISKVGIAE